MCVACGGVHVANLPRCRRNRQHVAVTTAAPARWLPVWPRLFCFAFTVLFAVMTLLFRSGSWQERLRAVLSATFEHASNLASFVFVYKLALAAGRALWQALQLPTNAKLGHPAVGWHAFVAGCLGACRDYAVGFLIPFLTVSLTLLLCGRVLPGGYLVWGTPTAVNQQIVMYLLSRIAIAAVKVIAARGVRPFSSLTENQA